MTDDTTATFTRTAAALVAANDRWAWLRGILAAFRDHARPFALAWSALVLVALVLWLVPMSVRVVGCRGLVRG